VDAVSYIGVGFFLGMFLFSHVARGIGLVAYTLSKQSGDFLGPPKRRLLWMAPIVAAINPGVLLLVFAGYIAAKAIGGHVQREVIWLLAGCATSFLWMGLLIVSVIRKARFRKASERAPNNPLDRLRPW
jgi:hypothetical protein